MAVIPIKTSDVVEEWLLMPAEGVQKSARALAWATFEGSLRARRGIPAPRDVTVSTVSGCFDQLQQHGQACKTIHHRLMLLGVITQTLLKGAYLPASISIFGT